MDVWIVLLLTVTFILNVILVDWRFAIWARFRLLSLPVASSSQGSLSEIRGHGRTTKSSPSLNPNKQIEHELPPIRTATDSSNLLILINLLSASGVSINFNYNSQSDPPYFSKTEIGTFLMKNPNFISKPSILKIKHRNPF